MRCHVIDALGTPGGQCAALYPEKPIYDIPGYPASAPRELIEKLEPQAAPFHPESTTSGDGSRSSCRSPRTLSPRDLRRRTNRGARGGRSPRGSAPSARTGRRSPASCLRGQERLLPGKRRDDFRGKRVVIAGGGDRRGLGAGARRGRRARHRRPPPPKIPRRPGECRRGWRRWRRGARSRWPCPTSSRALEGDGATS